ncbi:MAG: lactonase family protein [bacterium]|nr:lactonase family protein [bacterium]
MKIKVIKKYLTMVLVIAIAVSTFAFQSTANAAKDVEEGAVFAMTNETEGNRIVSYTRYEDGKLQIEKSTRTGGLGIGVDLDTQGGLRLSPDNRFLYAVNAGSDDISVFSVKGSKLKLIQRIAAGDQPVSMAIHDDLLYVLDGSVAEQGIMGFRIGSNGMLSPIPNSMRMLSSPIAVPGDIEFSPDGGTILVTHKVFNELVSENYIIDSFSINGNGIASAMPVINASNGIRPFALAFRDDGKVAVVEAFNASMGKTAVSSYNLNGGNLSVISGSVANGQTDGCWIVISKDQRFAFVANFGSGTISTYSFGADGSLTLVNGASASLGMPSQPVDLAQSDDGKYLYLLMRGTGGVASFEINTDGSLTHIADYFGVLPVGDGASGLAAY